MLKPVYDILDCGPRHRFSANGKLVHNSNWQNFRRGGEIRKSILAPEGHKLVIGDLSQIEYRLLCWLTGQTDKLDALASGRDLYSETASRFYEREVTKDDKPSRGLGKLITLSCGYGSGADSIKATARNGTYGPPLDLSDVDSLKARNLYRSEHPCVPAFWKWCDDALSVLANGRTTAHVGVIRIADHKIHLPNGTSLDYTGLRWARNCDVYQDQADDGEGYAWWETSRKGYTRTWGSHLTADIIQALAGAVIKDVWVRMLQRGYRPALQVHDELLFAVPAAKADECAAALLSEMETPPAWCADLPLAAEVLPPTDRYDK